MTNEIHSGQLLNKNNHNKIGWKTLKEEFVHFIFTRKLWFHHLLFKNNSTTCFSYWKLFWSKLNCCWMESRWHILILSTFFCKWFNNQMENEFKKTDWNSLETYIANYRLQNSIIDHCQIFNGKNMYFHLLFNIRFIRMEIIE